eukprot:TRINITY_DN5169_c0_g1_i1.p1 TRINITY_DN5169_c0_g1~~TRINITY_DN5169_c0_g1_i1.p1  ORF type:complete len:556 (+),score=108.94 TRINITY_DN5169_c0_g1_i1:86-1753(+)
MDNDSVAKLPKKGKNKKKKSKKNKKSNGVPPVSIKNTQNQITQKKKKKKKKKKNKKRKREEASGDAAPSPKKFKAADVTTITKYRDKNNIFILDGNLTVFDPEASILKKQEFFPLRSFAEANLDKDVLNVLLKKEYIYPTPIQAQAWPFIASDKDVVGIAETGSGKTLAFLLPAIIKLRSICREIKGSSKSKTFYRHPRVLVLSPTRELANQIYKVCKLFEGIGDNEALPIRALCIYGGVSKYDQINSINRGVNIIIATPGRLVDLVNMGKVDLSHVDYFVLDEADRMLDAGFEREVKRIVSQIKPCNQRKNLMFSATWPEDQIENFTAELFNTKNIVKIYIGNYRNSLTKGGDQHLEANANIKQLVEVVTPDDKKYKVFDLLKEYHSPKTKTLVFVLYKKEASFVENLLKRRGFECVSIHGDKRQHEREYALDAFVSGKVRMLVATDVAARGLDIPNVNTVINYTFPLTIEDYVHRIGRTGRAGKKGLSYTFFTTFDKSHSGELIQVLQNAGHDVPKNLYNFGTTIKRKKHALYGLQYNTDNRPMKEKSHVVFD